jgi:hypothetical protein
MPQSMKAFTASALRNTMLISKGMGLKNTKSVEILLVEDHDEVKFLTTAEQIARNSHNMRLGFPSL